MLLYMISVLSMSLHMDLAQAGNCFLQKYPLLYGGTMGHTYIRCADFEGDLAILGGKTHDE